MLSLTQQNNEITQEVTCLEMFTTEASILSGTEVVPTDLNELLSVYLRID